jgi:Glutamine amidotransferase domain
MCGIFGLISRHAQGFYQSDVSLFSQMMVADSVRGIDGTGIFGTYKDSGSVQWAKVGSHPYALLSSDKFTKWCGAMVRQMDMVVGHNRKATAGGKSNDNSHPFIHEHIILVHNGVIMNHKSMAETEVDSHAIAHGIVDKGYVQTLKELNGAFALVWFDMKDRKLRIVRNSDRPLWMGHGTDLIAFASEGPMLEWLGDRNSKQWKDLALIPPGVVISINQVNKKIELEKVELYTPKPTIWPVCTEFSGSGRWDDYGTPIPQIESKEEEEDQVTKIIQQDGEETDELVEKAAEFIKQYPCGKTVYFDRPVATRWNNTANGYTLNGLLRGTADIVVRSFYDGQEFHEHLKELCKSGVLTGKVVGTQVNPHTGQCSLRVGDVSTLNVYTSFNGTKLTADEWVSLCDKHKCTRCEKKLKIADIRGTSVNLSTAVPRLFCPSCVAIHISKLKPEVQERIAETNRIIQTTEKEWDLKGAAHGS